MDGVQRVSAQRQRKKEAGIRLLEHHPPHCPAGEHGPRPTSFLHRNFDRPQVQRSKENDAKFPDVPRVREKKGAAEPEGRQGTEATSRHAQSASPHEKPEEPRGQDQVDAMDEICEPFHRHQPKQDVGEAQVDHLRRPGQGCVIPPTQKRVRERHLAQGQGADVVVRRKQDMARQKHFTKNNQRKHHRTDQNLDARGRKASRLCGARYNDSGLSFHWRFRPRPTRCASICCRKP